MPRIARVVVPNYPHHITQRGTNRSEIFLADEDRRCFSRYLKETTQAIGIQVWAYCLMSNHFHLLLVPAEQESLGRCLHRLSFKYAQYFNRKYRRSGRLWQNRYFSCPVDRDEYLWVAARYIEKNPVRAKLVKEASDWEWSSARAHLNGRDDEILSSPSWLNEKDRTEYMLFLSDDGQEEEIRKATASGRPLGKINFYDKIKSVLKIDLFPKKGGRPKKEKIIDRNYDH